MKYLTTRRQLRRAFVLVNPTHGLKKQDLQMLELLRRHTISHQLIAAKCDHGSVKKLPELLFDIQSTIKSTFGFGKAGPVLMTINDIIAVAGLGDGQANKRVKGDNMRGLGDVRWAVLRAAGLEDYAMALLANGGLPPKRKSVPITQDASVVPSHTNDSPIAQPIVPSVSTPSRPDQLVQSDEPPVASSFAPQIGIGIQELMAMTTSSPQASRSQKSSGRSNKEFQEEVRRPRIRQPQTQAVQVRGAQKNERAGGAAVMNVDTSKIRRSLKR